MNWIQIANLSMAVVLLRLNLVLLRKIAKVRKLQEEIDVDVSEMLFTVQKQQTEKTNNCRTMHG